MERPDSSICDFLQQSTLTSHEIKQSPQSRTDAMGGTSDTASRGFVEEEEISRPTSPVQSSTADEDLLYSFVYHRKWRALPDGEAAYAKYRFAVLFDDELSRSGQLSESGSLTTWRNDVNASTYWVKINEGSGEDGKGGNQGWFGRGKIDSDYNLTIRTQIILDHVCQTYYSLMSLRHRPVDPSDAAEWKPTAAEFDEWANWKIDGETILAALNLRSKLLELTDEDPSLDIRYLKSEAMWCRRRGAPQNRSASQGIHKNALSDHWKPAWTLSDGNKTISAWTGR